MSSTQRAMPYHCPYCGDEDLRPHGAAHGEWECRGCQRAFRLGFIGILAPQSSTTQSSTTTGNTEPSGRRTA